MNLTTRLGMASVVVAAFAGGTTTMGAVDVIFTNLQGDASSDVPGQPGLKFRTPLAPFLTLNGSPDGSRWIFKGFADDGETIDVMIVGEGTSAVTAAVEAEAAPGGGTYSFFDSDCGIADDGSFAFGARLTGLATNLDEVVITGGGGTAGVLAVAVRESDPAPGLTDNPPVIAGDELFGNSLNSTSVLNDGTVTFRADQIQNVDTDFESAVYIGLTPQAQEGTEVNLPSRGGGVFIDSFTALSGNTFTTDADGTSWIVEIDADPALGSTVETVLVDGQTQFGDGEILGEQGSPVDGIFAVFMSGDGDWYVRGDNADNSVWVVRNGTVIASSGDAVASGVTAGVPTWTSFLAVTANSAGDYLIVGGASDGEQYAVVNGSDVVMSSGDFIDLNGDDIDNDDLFIDTFNANDAVLGDDGSVYAFVAMRDGVGTDVGDALVTIQAGACAGDVNGDGATDSADLSVLIGNFGMAVPPGTGGDLNGDGTVDSADLSVMIGDFGCPN